MLIVSVFSYEEKRFPFNMKPFRHLLIFSQKIIIYSSPRIIKNNLTV